MKKEKKSISHYKRLAKRPKTFRRLTGITPEKFLQLEKQLQPLYEEWNKKQLSKPKRKRKIGGGNKHILLLGDRLLLLLMYYRCYVTYEFLGFIFNIYESSVGRNFKPLESLLAGIFRIPERKVEISEDEFLTLFFDGTEQKRERPTKRQRIHYSGKKKMHTVKYQVIVVKKKKKPGIRNQKRKLRIAAVSKAFSGKTHDKQMYEKTNTIRPPGTKGKGDLGYQGTDLEIPIKKPRGKNPS